MRTVCIQFIDLVVQLIIEPDYREDIQWSLNYLMKLGSLWSVADIYYLMRNGILTFHYRQDIFHRYLIRIQNLLAPPSLSVCLGNNEVTIGLKSMLYCRDENKLLCSDKEPYAGQEEKSLDQVLMELNGEEVKQEEENSIRNIIKNSKTKLEKYKEDFEGGIEQELERILNSEQKDGIDVLSSCLSVVSMALYTCKGYWPLNTQLVSYCLLLDRKK